MTGPCEDLSLNPLMAQLRSGLSEASAASLALEIIDGVFRRWHTGGLVAEEVAAHSARVSGYHRKRLIQTFSDGARYRHTAQCSVRLRYRAADVGVASGEHLAYSDYP